MSPGRWTKSYWRGTNIWLPKTVSCGSMQGRLKLSNAERATLGEIAHRLGCKALAEVATVATPDTILAWYRKLVARKFDGSKAHRAQADRGSRTRWSS